MENKRKCRCEEGKLCSVGGISKVAECKGQRFYTSLFEINLFFFSIFAFLQS